MTEPSKYNRLCCSERNTVTNSIVSCVGPQLLFFTLQAYTFSAVETRSECTDVANNATSKYFTVVRHIFRHNVQGALIINWRDKTLNNLIIWGGKITGISNIHTRNDQRFYLSTISEDAYKTIAIYTEFSYLEYVVLQWIWETLVFSANGIYHNNLSSSQQTLHSKKVNYFSMVNFTAMLRYIVAEVIEANY